MLFYADSAFPDWHATVDGVSQPIVVAASAFKAVSLTAGAHRVEFRYRAPWGLTGVEALTLSTVMFVLLLAGLDAWLVAAMRRR